MALAIVQAKKIESGSAGSTTVNSALTVTGANLLVVGMTGFGASATDAAASDNVNGSYTQVNDSAADADGSRAAILYKANITGGTLNLTANAGTSSSAVTASWHEVSGADTSAPFTTGEQASNSGGVSSNPQTALVTNATADSVFFAVLGNGEGGSSGTFTVNSTGSTPTGWALKSSTDSQEVNGSSFQSLSVPSLIVTSSAATRHGWTTGNFDFCYAIACFKIAGAGGPQDTPELYGRPDGLRGQRSMHQILAQ